MAGIKGRSGGARSGAGRKPKQVSNEVAERSESVRIPDCDMLKLLQDVALGIVEASPIQVRAAIAAVQYTHAKVGEGGKKEQQQDAAKKVASRFAPSAPPKLVAAGGRKV